MGSSPTRPTTWENASELPDPTKLGDLTLWETSGEDGEELGIWAEMSTDPAAAGAVEDVKRIMRDLGWQQMAGD